MTGNTHRHTHTYSGSSLNLLTARAALKDLLGNGFKPEPQSQPQSQCPWEKKGT